MDNQKQKQKSLSVEREVTLTNCFDHDTLLYLDLNRSIQGYCMAHVQNLIDEEIDRITACRFKILAIVPMISNKNQLELVLEIVDLSG